MKAICKVLYVGFFIMGMVAAYRDQIAVALFFAITCAGESIAVSIDYWPRLRDKKEAPDTVEDAKEEAKDCPHTPQN